MISDKELPNRNFKWIDVHRPEEGEFERLKDDYDLPFLLVQDLLRPEHLPKYEDSESGHFLMMRSFDEDSAIDDTTVQCLTRKIAIFITEHRILTIHRVELGYLERVAEKASKTGLPKTIEGLVHQIILAVIKSYEAPLARLQDQYEEFEQEVLAKKTERLSTKQIYQFRRQNFILKRILRQTNDALTRFKDYWLDHPSMLQDLKENIDQLYFQLDEISSNFEHLFELHISLNEQRANEVMKVLTVFSTVLLPLNFVASFYGMNFSYLPGLGHRHAVSFLVVAMLIMVLFAVWFFRRKGWFRTTKE